MPVARCCAAVPKQRDSFMLSYTLGFPMQRDVLMLSYTQGFTFRGMSSCCHASWALPMQRDVLMLSYKPGCNPDFPCIAAGGT